MQAPAYIMNVYNHKAILLVFGNKALIDNIWHRHVCAHLILNDDS